MMKDIGDIDKFRMNAELMRRFSQFILNRRGHPVNDESFDELAAAVTIGQVGEISANLGKTDEEIFDMAMEYMGRDNMVSNIIGFSYLLTIPEFKEEAPQEDEA